MIELMEDIEGAEVIVDDIVTRLRLLVITFAYFLKYFENFQCFVQAEPFDHWVFLYTDCHSSSFSANPRFVFDIYLRTMLTENE